MSRAVDVAALRVTPAVWAVVYLLGVWAEPIVLAGWFPGVVGRGLFLAAAALSLLAMISVQRAHRQAALLAGTLATLSRGLTIVVVGLPGASRKSEIIGGSVWISATWFAVVIFALSAPVATAWRVRRWP